MIFRNHPPTLCCFANVSMNDSLLQFYRVSPPPGSRETVTDKVSETLTEYRSEILLAWCTVCDRYNEMTGSSNLWLYVLKLIWYSEVHILSHLWKNYTWIHYSEKKNYAWFWLNRHRFIWQVCFFKCHSALIKLNPELTTWQVCQALFGICLLVKLSVGVFS